MTRRVVEWWKQCNDCHQTEQGTSEYVGMNFWYCTSCGSKSISGWFKVVQQEVTSPE